MKTDYKTVSADLQTDVVVLTMNNPPVNQLSEHFVMDVADAMLSAAQDDRVKALVLTGTGGNFIAGADITQLAKVKDEEPLVAGAMELADFFNTIEMASKPIIAAINGNALGGGLEFAMACHYRVAAKGVQVGLPEVTLGLIPGSGGTQRLPRLVGLTTAVDMITSGKYIDVQKGLSFGLIDEVVEPGNLVQAAINAARKFLARTLKLEAHRTRNKYYRLPSAMERQAFCNGAKYMTMQKAKGYTAPLKALDAIEQGLTFDIERDIQREVRLFGKCAVSDVAKNLIGMFLGTRAAGRLPRIEGLQPATIKKVVMLGSGVMGSSITNLLLQGGYQSVLWDVSDTALQKGLAALRTTFAYPIKKKKMTKENLDSMINNQLTVSTSLADAKDADLIIEAVLEDMKVKQDIWKQLESICPQHTIFATNTSALPITEMASVLKDPSRMIGLHFFNPAERMQLLEVICTKHTSDQCLASSVAFARAIKKVPIVVNDGPGFYVSRQLGGLFGATVFLTADGVDGQAVEKAILDFGMPMGPAVLADLTGIDIGYHVNKTFERTLGERYKVHPLTEIIYQTGCYGRKTGAGYLDYSGPTPVPNPKVIEPIKKYLAENNVQPKEMSAQEIVDTLLALGINEAALMMEEGIIDRPQDMDLAMIYGTGFPAYRGGIMRYADKWGIKNVYDKLLELEASYGIRFKPADLIKEMAETGRAFYQDC